MGKLDSETLLLWSLLGIDSPSFPHTCALCSCVLWFFLLLLWSYTSGHVRPRNTRLLYYGHGQPRSQHCAFLLLIHLACHDNAFLGCLLLLPSGVVRSFSLSLPLAGREKKTIPKHPAILSWTTLGGWEGSQASSYLPLLCGLVGEGHKHAS